MLVETPLLSPTYLLSALNEVSTLLQAGSCHIQVMDRVAANDKNFF